MSGFIEERFELHMLSDSTPLNQFQTDSSYLLGHIPDEIADDYSILFSKKPENLKMYSICTQKA